MGEKLYDE